LAIGRGIPYHDTASAHESASRSDRASSNSLSRNAPAPKPPPAHLRTNTSGAGYESCNRYYFAQTQKEGAVIDERFNGGGAPADYIVEYLSRPLLNYIAFRDGRDVPTPLGPSTARRR
jgi:hypothetical protein